MERQRTPLAAAPEVLTFQDMTPMRVPLERLIHVVVLCLAVVFISPAALRADPVTDHNLVVQFYKQQRWQLVAETAEEYLRKYPRDQRAATIRLYRGQALVHLRDFKTAREEFRQFLKDAGTHADRPLAQYRVGEASYFLSDFETARTELRRFLADHGDHELAEWATVYLGEVQFRLNDGDGAVKAFQQYLAKYPQGRLIDDAEYGLARAHEILGQTAESLRLFEKIAARPNSSRGAEAQFNVGARHFDDGNYRPAAEAFQAVTARYREHSLVPLAELNAGYALYHLQDYEAAIRHFEKAAAQPGQQETATYWIGLSHKSLGDHERAAAIFQDSLREKPDQPLAENLTFHWGDAELRRGNHGEALDLFVRTANRWPQGELADDALHSATEAAFQSGDLKRAIELHQRFEKSFPESGLRQIQNVLYGRVLIAQGDAAESDAARPPFYENAVAVLKQVMQNSKLPRTQHSAGYQLARAHERLKQDAAVAEVLDALLKPDGSLSSDERRDLLLLRGNARLRLKDFNSARRDYDELLKLQPTDEQKLSTLAGLAGALTAGEYWKELSETLRQLDDQDEQDQHFSRVGVVAGDAAFDREQWDKAEVSFQRVVNRGPQGRYYLVALSGLGHAVYESGRFDEAAALFERLADEAASDRKLHSHAAYMRGMSLRQAERMPEALAAFQRGQELFTLTAKENPDAAELPVGMNAYRCAKGGARVARELEQIETADQLYERAYHELKKQPSDQQQELDLLINEWADLSYNAENYARSDELYALLIQERPESPLAGDARLILAESLRFGGQSAKARQAFQTLADDPKSSEFVQQRSLVHLLDLEAEGANWDAVLKAAAALTARFPDSQHQDYAAYRMGEAQLQSKQYQQAAESLGELRRKLSADLGSAAAWWPEAWILQAEAFYGLKEYAKLEAVLDDLRDKAPESPLLYRADAVLGRSLENRARFDEARAAYRRVIESESGQGTETAAEAQFRIAESFLKQNNFRDALKEYYKVYAGYDAPRYESAALLQAARCDASLKNWRGAVESYRTLLKEFPDSEFARDAEMQLAEIERVFPELKSERP